MGLDLLRASGGSRACHAALALLLAAGLGGLEARAAADEAEVKAALVYKFLLFVEWPEGARGEQAVTLCALGAPAVADALETIAEARELHGRALALNRLGKAEHAGDCHALFVGTGGEPLVDGLLRRLEGRPVLTVSDLPDFARRGGMIGLFRQGDRMRFAVNPRRAEAAGLGISSKLLRLAQIVSE